LDYRLRDRGGLEEFNSCHGVEQIMTSVGLKDKCHFIDLLAQISKIAAVRGLYKCR
jgi:hypothetical protein